MQRRMTHLAQSRREEMRNARVLRCVRALKIGAATAQHGAEALQQEIQTKRTPGRSPWPLRPEHRRCIRTTATRYSNRFRTTRILFRAQSGLRKKRATASWTGTPTGRGYCGRCGRPARRGRRLAVRDGLRQLSRIAGAGARSGRAGGGCVGRGCAARARCVAGGGAVHVGCSQARVRGAARRQAACNTA